jgi:hypothetical protein
LELRKDRTYLYHAYKEDVGNCLKGKEQQNLLRTDHLPNYNYFFVPLK